MNISTILSTTDFILEGFSDHNDHQILFFVVFLTVYVICLMGNTLIVLITLASPKLHSPMYFFLSNLSVTDMSLISVVIPQLLHNLLDEKKTISFIGCIAQVYFFISFAGVECFILTLMAYDRYVAVCKPLHYVTIMSRTLCIQMVAISWITNLTNSVLHTLLIARLSFCKSHIIQHFFCDLTPLYKLSCSDITVNKLVIFTEGSLIVALPFLLTLISYIHIIWTIIKISSFTKQEAAFSTCSAHLTSVILFYGTMICIYFRPSSSYAIASDKVAAILYTVFTPTVNPFIYSLRNKDVKREMKKLFNKSTVKSKIVIADENKFKTIK
ncbi:olfactory receptor 1J4-like [Bombina bombina]|uniref:olfactory receptor 1J4-like n=1 Tax=Bombina bombina TaxID=8345 RepID=UPI00235A4C61|nr:olfactory receptor 1J4-like [Bombina bombina]